MTGYPFVPLPRYPAEGATVPAISKTSLGELASFR